jgi:diguanylate cyclase (GGDEF)-like protein
MDWQNRKCRILVVDDDVVSRTMLDEHLSAAGHQVLLASSVSEAIEVFERETVQIVIADWLMPQATGIELCQWVRQRHSAAPIHFVMLTVLSEKARLIEAFEAGVDDFLSKPLHEGELLARLRAWTRIVTLQEQLAEQATRDELTCLPNRREAIRCLSDHWSIAIRYDRPLSCAVVDVDNFKQINDSAGHGVGDAVLRHLASLLSASVRASDTVFRIGGDEFLVLLPDTTEAEALQWADRSRETVAAHPDGIRTTISIGVAQREKAMQDWREMVEAADAALLAGKRDGRSITRQSAQLPTAAAT